ncbi:unnamed protein product [Sphagnum troendelagicum]|uniref:UspA domain-containing protein n=1 Tax=Sphagnum troendelagicum TaxID=128251 RepID=A0ABP0UGF5_9BRYO
MEAIAENRELTQAELEHETCERRRGRNIVVAIDHGPDSRAAFEWTLTHFARMADTLYLVHVIPSLSPRKSTEEKVLSQVAESLMDKLAKEAYEVCMVKTVPRILEGIDIGKAICTEAERIQPAAVVMGSRGLGFVKSFIQGSVSDYCARHCPCAVIIMPHRGVEGEDD